MHLTGYLIAKAVYKSTVYKRVVWLRITGYRLVLVEYIICKISLESIHLKGKV